jgi:hypothetical protein
VDKILDTAEQKGTGKWTGISAFDMGIPLTLIIEAVLSRALSALKDERVAASGVLSGPKARIAGDRKAFILDLEEALYASKLISYTQGMLMRRREEYSGINYGGIAPVAGRLHHPLGTWGRSRRPSTGIRSSPTSCSIPTSGSRSTRRRRRGGASLRKPFRRASRCRRCPAAWPFSTATAANRCLQTYSRRSAIISARTPTSAWTSRPASTSTRTGPATGAT